MKKSLIEGGIPVMEHPENKLRREDKISILKDYSNKQYTYLTAMKDNIKPLVELAHQVFMKLEIKYPYLCGQFKEITKLWESCYNEQNRHEIARKGLKTIYDSIK